MYVVHSRYFDHGQPWRSRYGQPWLSMTMVNHGWPWLTMVCSSWLTMAKIPVLYMILAVWLGGATSAVLCQAETLGPCRKDYSSAAPNPTTRRVPHRSPVLLDHDLPASRPPPPPGSGGHEMADRPGQVRQNEVDDDDHDTFVLAFSGGCLPW